MRDSQAPGMILPRGSPGPCRTRAWQPDEVRRGCRIAFSANGGLPAASSASGGPWWGRDGCDVASGLDRNAALPDEVERVVSVAGL